MTTGTMLFYSGAALLILTVILAVIFLIKKPKYSPENTAYMGDTTGATQKLRNAYPTDHMTKSEGAAKRMDQATELMTSDMPAAAPATELITDTLPTELMQGDTELIGQGVATELLDGDK